MFVPGKKFFLLHHFGNLVNLEMCVKFVFVKSKITMLVL